MEKVIVSIADLNSIVDPISEKVAMNNELKEDFNSLSMSERIDAFDK
jgi:hypothetical protein